MIKRTKVNKHLKWLNEHKYERVSYGDKILFINKYIRFDKLTTCFYIDVKQRKVYSHFMGAHLFFEDYKKNIDLYCFHRYGWFPSWEHKGTEEFGKVKINFNHVNR